MTTIFQADLETGVKAAAEAGFGAVELWVDSLERYLESHTTGDLRDLLQIHDIEVLGIGDIESITFCDSEQKDELHRRCRNLAAVANAISCPTLIASASVRPRDADRTRVAEETASVIGELLDIIEPAGVALALVFRGFVWCAVNTLAIARDAVSIHAGRRIGLALDTFDIHASGVSLDELKALEPTGILIVRLSDCEDVPAAILSETDRALPGEGAAEIGGILRALREGGYCGPVSLKIPSPRLLGLDASEAAKVVLTVSRPYLDGAVAEKEIQA